MSYRRRNAGVVCHDGLLFVVGGDDGTSNLSNVEVSKCVRKLFQRSKPIHGNPKQHSHSNTLFPSSTQVYCSKTDTWRILSASMGIGRSYAGVCIIDKPM